MWTRHVDPSVPVPNGICANVMFGTKHGVDKARLRSLMCLFTCSRRMSQPPLNVDISIGTRLFRQSPNDVFLATFVSQPWMSCVALEATSHTKGMSHTALLRLSSFYELSSAYTYFENAF